MKRLSGKRARDRAIRADQPEVEAELLHNGQGKSVTTSGDYDDFDTQRVSAAKRCEIGFGDLELGIEERPVNIDGNEAKGIGGHTQF